MKVKNILLETPKINFFIEYPKQWDKKELRIFKEKVKFLAKKVFSLENELCHIINLNLTNDEKIKELNKIYLNHNYETDVLTFRYDDEVIEADVIISLDTVKNNSLRFKTNFWEELYRVVIHGMLHICGYDDKSEKQKLLMQKKENIYLKMLKEESNVSRKNT